MKNVELAIIQIMIMIAAYLIGTPINSSNLNTKAWQLAGKSSNRFTVDTSSVQPFITSYSTTMLEYSASEAGMPSTSLPFKVYFCPIFTSGKPLNTSNFVKFISVKPDYTVNECISFILIILIVSYIESYFSLTLDDYLCQFYLT